MKDAPNLCTKIVPLYHNYPLLEKKKIILLAYMLYTLTYPINLSQLNQKSPLSREYRVGLIAEIPRATH